MGTWNASLKGNDTFLDTYQNFFELYNEGLKPEEASKRIIKDFGIKIDVYDDDDDERTNSLFGLALAQWETKSLDPKVFERVKEMIVTGEDLELMKGLGADEKMLKERKRVLENFISKISITKEKPKRRIKPVFTSKYIFGSYSPDRQKTLSLYESYTKGIYDNTNFYVWGPHDNHKELTLGYYSTSLYDPDKLLIVRWLDDWTIEVLFNRYVIFKPDIEILKKEGTLKILFKYNQFG